MKKLASLILAGALAVSALAMNVSAAEKGTAYGKVPATDTAITIDGKKDAIYDKGLEIKIDTLVESKELKGSGVAKLLWNGKDTFYLYAEIKDSNIVKYDGDISSGKPNAWDTDSLEVFFDYSNKVARTRDQYRLDIKNAPTYYDSKSYFAADVGKFGFEKWGMTEISGGYALEFQIKAYKEAISAGMNIGFHLMINDMGGDARLMYHSDKCGNKPADFGYITLSGDKVKIDAPKPAAPAAATADFTAVAALAVIAAGAVLVIKKNH